LRKLREEAIPNVPTQISYDPYRKPPTYNLAMIVDENEMDSEKKATEEIDLGDED